MNVSDDPLAEPVVEGRGVVFDARNQYYRIWMWLIAQVKAAQIEGEPRRWARTVEALYNHARSFLPEADRAAVEAALAEAKSSAYALNALNRRDWAFREASGFQYSVVEEKLNFAVRTIYDGMKSGRMLLPESQGVEASLDLEKMMKEADLR